MILSHWCLGRAKSSAEEGLPEPIQQIFRRHCVECHSADSRDGDLNLDSWRGMQKGGESGPVINPTAPLESHLWKKIASGEMPPEESAPLHQEELNTIEQWLSSTDWSTWTNAQPLNQHDVLPILLLRCATCHGGQQQQGGLDIRSVEALLRGGESGPAIVAGAPQDSLILKRIHSEEMPPREDLARYSVKPMEPLEIEILERWILAGASVVDIKEDVATDQPDPLVSDLDRDFWAFQPPRQTSTPTVAPFDGWNTSDPIDTFILDQQSDHHLQPSPPASPEVLIRRLFHDLHGLPPAPEELDEFLDDYATQGEAAWPRWIDRLLASPRYGERWGGFWLDAAGYSDSEGVQHSDPVRPYVWRYRDYVIRSFDSDKSYAQFLREQLAGDELFDFENAPVISEEMYDAIVATAFLKLSPDGTFAGITGFVPDRLEAIDDSLEVLSSAVMGLTIRCARCHSHKFDPIPQRDYYRLSAVFKGALDEHSWLQPIRQSDLPGVGVRHLPFVTQTERQAWEEHESQIDREIETAKEAGKTEEDIKAIGARRQPEPRVRALWDSGAPSPTYLLRRGNYQLTGDLVGPGVPSVLTDGQTPFNIQPPWPDSNKTGRRLAFANWLVEENHPLTSRVIMNRLWRHHFGRGIVETLDDFGRAGSGATHPELLDWLAVELQRGDWSLKRMQRKLLATATWRQASRVTPSHKKDDPENRYWTRMPMRRLDAEELRDTLLLASGKLSFQRFGPAVPVSAQGDGIYVASENRGERRRSIYIQKRRTEPLTLLSTFDRPAMSPNCIDRSESTVAPQALHLMNNQVIQQLAIAFADRLHQEPHETTEDLLAHACQLTLGRNPNDQERVLLASIQIELTSAWRHVIASQQPELSEDQQTQLAHRRALETVCHTLFNSASLLFVD
jgi:mono/diheme cytochrome c family protein